MPLNYVNDTVGHVYTPPLGSPSADAYSLSNPPSYSPYQSPEGRNQSRFQILGTEDDGEGGKRIMWRLEIYDLRQGFKQTGRFEDDYGSIASSTLSTAFQAQGILPFLTTGDTSQNPSVGGTYMMRSANVFGTLAIALDNFGAQSFLYKETSTTNPAITAITYAKAKAISCLATATILGVEYLLVGLRAGTAEGLQNLTTGGPTAIAMNAAVSSLYGAVQTFLPNQPILLSMGGVLASLDSTLGIATAPTTVLASFPGDGYQLGLQSMGGAPVRAWWLVSSRYGATFWPGTAGGTSWRGYIMSTAQDGSTPQKLVLPLSNVHNAVIYRDGIVATDEQRVIFHNGRYIRDFKIFKDVAVNSNLEYRATNLIVQGAQLFAEVNIRATTAGTGNTIRCLWAYDYDQDSWFQVSANFVLGGTGTQSFGGQAASSDATGFVHTRTVTDHEFWRIFQPPYAVNPFSYRKTSGAAAGTGQEFEASGALTPTACELPGLEGMPKIIRSVQFMGDVDAGGTGTTPAKINVTAPGIDTSAHSQGDFVTGNSGKLQRRDFEDNVTSFYKFQPTITATRQIAGTDPTRFTPQVLPIAFEGVAYYRPWIAPAGRQEVNT